jgi:hypothetical protein
VELSTSHYNNAPLFLWIRHPPVGGKQARPVSPWIFGKKLKLKIKKISVVNINTTIKILK